MRRLANDIKRLRREARLVANSLEAYPLDAPWSVRGSCSSADDLRCGDRVEVCRLLEQPVEKEAAVGGGATVEAEGVLVEVEVELADADPAVVGSKQPALEQRGDAVDARHRHVGGVGTVGDVGRMVDEAGFGEAVVAVRVVAAPSPGAACAAATKRSRSYRARAHA